MRQERCYQCNALMDVCDLIEHDDHLFCGDTCLINYFADTDLGGGFDDLNELMVELLQTHGTEMVADAIDFAAAELGQGDELREHLAVLEQDVDTD